MTESPREAEAARRDLMREAVRTRHTLLTAIAIATLLILAAVGYQRCTDPWWRCKRLVDDVTGPEASPSREQSRAWDELECDQWPGI